MLGLVSAKDKRKHQASQVVRVIQRVMLLNSWAGAPLRRRHLNRDVEEVKEFPFAPYTGNSHCKSPQVGVDKEAGLPRAEIGRAHV